MDRPLNRRGFLATSAAAGAGVVLASGFHRLEAAPEKATPEKAMAWKTTLHKAMIGSPSESVFKTWKAAGFDGMETTDWNVPVAKAAAARKLAEAEGMRIHSVLFGWGKLNGGDAARAETVKQMKTALQAAQAYGANAVLLVPCRIDGMDMPAPWEFDIRFDENSGHLAQVVAGENAKYQKYIEAHNHAADTSRQGVKELIPAAEKAGVVIALENVWNNLWVKPEVAAHFVASFDSPWVKAYYDIGNHVKYAPSEEWIRTLGKLIVKCHVKDYKLGPDGRGDGHAGFCNIREGSVNWPAVRKALDEIGYNGWLTIEGGDLSPEEHSKRLDLIIAGD
jgi:hexulose-6-phosphate isomerase